ncbi:MAG: lipid A biosynthesis acyltransferase [Planctomycetaceae bacterium]|nr:lipid A biosynthesis acyltransferase [Planctomycetaceae bacterium]
MARNQSALTNWSQYLAMRLAASALHAFPINQNLRSARFAGSLMYRFDGEHRRRALRNIARSLPGTPASQAPRIAEKSLQHFLQLGVEVMFTTRLIHLDTWSRYMRLQQLSKALDVMLSDRPTIMVTGHYGNWELLGYTLATLGLDMDALARPIDNPLVNRWLTDVRQKRGMRLITKWGATDDMVRIMANRGTLAFIADQNAGEKGLFVPFFGRLASTYKSIGLLAMQFNAPIVCGYARRLGPRFEYELGTTDVIYPEDWTAQPDPLYYLTARYMRAIETMVRLDPTQYLWVHRRWKSRPRHERQAKPMPAGLRHQLEMLPWMTDELMARLQRA